METQAHEQVYDIALGEGQSLACALPEEKLRDLVLLQLANHFGPLCASERETIASRMLAQIRAMESFTST